MHRDIEEVEFTVFDTETTGLDPYSGDRIVELAGIRIKGGKKIASFQSLVNPHREISPAAFSVNRITPEMLKGAPPIKKVLPEFLDFSRGSCLCSYNAPFDMGFLREEAKLTGRDRLEKNDVVDVLKMAKRILPGLERYALWFVADKLGIKAKQEHRAFSDVELTLKVFFKLREILKNKGVFDFASFLSLFAVSSALLSDINNQKLAKIQEAMDLGVSLKIRYLATSTAEVSEREVIPKEIRQENKKSYLVGYCYLKKEERTFRIDGILNIQPDETRSDKTSL